MLTVNFAQDRQRSNLDVEKKRPIGDIEKVVAHPVFDLLLSGRLAAPTIDLRPTRDARLDPMA